MTAGKPLVFTFSEAGGHPRNEDAFGVRPHPADEGALLVALADGVGGHAGGGRAAELAVRSALETASSWPLGALDWPGILGPADTAVSGDRDAGFTTLVGLTVKENRVSGASCGDSAVWATDASGRALQLTARQHKNPPVGTGAALFAAFGAALTPPWLLIAMTDGVWKYVGWHRITEAAFRLRGRQLIDELQALARLPGSGKLQDDFTLIVIQSDE